MRDPLVPIFHGGRIKNIDIVDSGTFSVDTSNHHEACPTNKRWQLLSVNVDPDNSATITVEQRDSGNQMVATLGYEGAGTNHKTFPDVGAAGQLSLPLVLLIAGDYIDIAFGAAQGAASRIKIRVLEYDV